MHITLETFSLFIAMIASSAIGVYAILTHKKSFMHRSFGLLALGLSVWGMSIALLYLTQVHMFFFCTLIFMSGSLWFFALLMFSYSFPANKIPPKKFYVWAIPTLIIFILSPFKLFVSDFSINEQGYLEPIHNLIFFGPFLVVFFTYIVYSAILIYRNYQEYKKIPLYRIQFRYLFVGLGIFIFSILVFDTILPAFGIYQLNMLGPDAGIIFFICVGYAIVRHKLMDIRILIQRGLIYICIIAIIVGLYVVSLQFLGYVLHKATNITAVISAGSIMCVGIFLVRPLDDYFRKITDPIFFKEKYDYPEALHRLSKILQTNVTLVDIVTHSSVLLRSLFKTDFVGFRLLEDQEYEQIPVVAATTQIVFEGRPIAILELGPKKSGDKYTVDDLMLLETFACQAAVALEKGRLYNKVEEYSVHLERLVEERTLEIKKLHEDQKQAMIDISHNLQTPLAIIRAEIDLLSGTTIPAEKIKMTKIAITRVSQFIRQLLHLAKLDHEGFAVELVPLDLSLLLAQEIEYFEVMAAEKEIQFISSIEKGVYIRGNRKLINELLMNLISNAIKYRKRNSDKNMITISLDRVEDQVRLIVRDKGIGIFINDMSDIFKRFYRSRHACGMKGTGLGLAISKKIVERHAGSISVQSIPQKETSFTILFKSLPQ